MKTLLVIISSILFLFCSNGEKISTANTKADSHNSKESQDQHDEIKAQCLNATEYQTFDEFSMKGIGKAIKSPSVWVKTSDNAIEVNGSYRDSVRVYRKIAKGAWHSHMEFEMWKKANYHPYKCEWDNYARTYDRYFYHDTIAEIATYYYDGKVFTHNLYIKTHDNVLLLRGVNIKPSTNFSDMHKSINLCISTNSKNASTGKYILQTEGNRYLLKGEKTTYEYERKAYGVWGMQPGIDETRLINGIDIRSYSHQHPSGDLADTKDDFVFDLAEQMPRLKGDKGNYWDKKQLGDQMNAHGRVIVEFIVERDGKASHVRIAKSAGNTLDNKALEIFATLPDWNPAEIEGKKVRCKMNFPFNF